MIPPHLPPPSCNIENHHRWQRLKILLAAALFGLVAGGSGAAMMLGWIWPGLGEGDMWTVARYRSGLSRVQLEERVREEIRARIMTVYPDLAITAGVNYLRSDAKLGEAIVVSSDGWLAMYLPSFNGAYKNWRVLTAEGTVYKVSQVISDPYSQIIYLKIFSGEQADTAGGAEQLQVVSFADAVNLSDDVFIFEDGNWLHSLIESRRPVFSGVNHLDSAPVFVYTLSTSFRLGSVVVNNQGRIAGVVIDNGLLLPSDVITRILPVMLSRQSVKYPSLGVEGWFDAEQPIIINGVRVQGFAVMRTLSKKTLLRRGDVVLEVNGRVVSPEALWYIINGNQKVRLKIIRAGKTIEIENPVVEL